MMLARRSIAGVLLAALILTPWGVGAALEHVVFHVDPQYEEHGTTKETAQFVSSSTYALFYVEQAYFSGLTAAQQQTFRTKVAELGQQFDTMIYPRVRALFGEEWTPGIDNDVRITVYFTNMPEQYNGYFRESDQRVDVSASNRREMVYLNAVNVLKGGELPAFFAHEFQHVVLYNQKNRLHGVHEERWLNEALSEYAVTVAGFEGAGNHLRTLTARFKSSPNTSLTVWNDSVQDYAATSLFAHYLADQYGPELLSAIAKNNLTGTLAVTSALHEVGTDKDFSRVFAEWTVALFLNQAVGQDTTYQYQHPLLRFEDLRISARSTFSMEAEGVIETSTAMQDFTPQWYRFVPSFYEANNARFLSIHVETFEPGDLFVVPVIVTTVDGTVTVRFQEIQGGSGTIDIPNFTGNVSSVVVIPSSHTKLQSFDTGENRFRVITMRAVLSDDPQSIGEGDVIRAEGSPKVYVATNGYRRWIQSPDIMDMYGHLHWDAVRELSPDIVEALPESMLVQLAGDPRVFEVTAAGQRHWLDMTPAQFEASGRSWRAIYLVNEKEFSWFRQGARIVAP